MKPLGNETTVVNDSTSLPDYSGSSTEDLLRLPVVRNALLVIYSLIFFSSLISNIFVFVTVLADRKMHSLTNVFIANLACADILMCAFSVVFTPLSLLIEDWSFGPLVCKLIPTSCAMSVFVISWTSTMIAVDRYIAIVHPHAKRMKVLHGIAASIAIWTVAISVTLPIAFHHQVVDNNWDGKRVCIEIWDENLQHRQLFTYLCLALQYLMPVAIIAFAYASILVTLNRRLKANLRKCPNSQRASRIAKLEGKRRVTWMLMIILASFMICWVPLNVLNMLTEYEPEWIQGGGIMTFVVCHLFASCSTIFNAILYAGMNEDFKRRLRGRGCFQYQFQRKISCLVNAPSTTSPHNC